MKITKDELSKLLSYDHVTGVFVRIKRTSNRVNVGDIAGSIDKNGYRHISLNNYSHYAHRLAWLYFYGELPSNIDHINGIRDDNKISNLRNVSHKENLKNTFISKNNTSGITGVYWCGRNKYWYSKIKINYKSIHLGSFKNKDDAIKARKNANIKYGFHKNHGRDRVIK